MAKNNKSGSRIKYIDIKYLAVRKHIKDQIIIIDHISIELMIVDLLTKGMPPSKFKDRVEKWDLVPIFGFRFKNEFVL